MTTQEIKQVAERNPFRPFTVRLSNGMVYRFERPRDIGAPEDYRMIFCFANNQSVRIDTDSITEIIES
jgi:hypothetical protein